MRVDFRRIMGSNRIMTALTISDFFVWSSREVLMIVFILFALQYIDGASTTLVGASSFVYMLMAGLSNLPFGRLLDKEKGYVDETRALTIATIVRGLGLIGLSFSTSLWQLFVLQGIMGLATSMNYVAWRALFSNYMDKTHAGEEWGAYQTFMSIGYGIAALAGGFLADHYPFNHVVLLTGVVTVIGGLVPLLVMKDVQRKS